MLDQATIVIEGSLPSVDLALGGAASLQRRSEFRVLFITIAPRRRVLQEPGTPHLEFGERVRRWETQDLAPTKIERSYSRAPARSGNLIRSGRSPLSRFRFPDRRNLAMPGRTCSIQMRGNAAPFFRMKGLCYLREQADRHSRLGRSLIELKPPSQRGLHASLTTP